MTALLRNNAVRIVRVGSGLPAEQRQRKLTGHITAVQQCGAQQWDRMFPCPMESLPTHFSVVLLGTASNIHELRALAGRARAMKVRHALPVTT